MAHWYGERQAVPCTRCGARHHVNSPTRRYCDIWKAQEDEQHSAAGITRIAAAHRADGIRHWERGQREDGSVSEIRRRMAHEAFAKAYELEA